MKGTSRALAEPDSVDKQTSDMIRVVPFLFLVIIQATRGFLVHDFRNVLLRWSNYRHALPRQCIHSCLSYSLSISLFLYLSSSFKVKISQMMIK